MENVPLRTHTDDPIDLKTVLQQTHAEALVQNDFATRHWAKVRDEHVSLRSHLVVLPETLSQEVMVPIGSKALMRGKMVHTNEILVCLGDGWFVKQTAKKAAEICNRRILLCENMLKDLERERELLIGRMQIPLDEDAFGAEEREELLEPYDEKKEAQWRVEHQKKQMEYRKKLKELKNQEKTSIENEESLWKRLDELELQEELEEELDRLHAERQEMGYDDEDDEDDDLEPSDNQKPSVRRVSFADTKKNSDSDEDSDSSAETLRIGFHHTPMDTGVQQNKGPGDHPIQTPHDIYKYIKDLIQKDGVPKSILKNKGTEPMVHQHLQWEEPSSTELELDEKDEDNTELEDKPMVFGEVLEHEVVHELPSTSEPPVTTAPTSRFKAARLAAKR